MSLSFYTRDSYRRSNSVLLQEQAQLRAHVMEMSNKPVQLNEISRRYVEMEKIMQVEKEERDR